MQRRRIPVNHYVPAWDVIQSICKSCLGLGLAYHGVPALVSPGALFTGRVMEVALGTSGTGSAPAAALDASRSIIPLSIAMIRLHEGKCRRDVGEHAMFLVI